MHHFHNWQKTPYILHLILSEWWDDINNGNEVELIFSEKSLLCKYFGGTLDCLLKINGKYYSLGTNFVIIQNKEQKGFLATNKNGIGAIL